MPERQTEVQPCLFQSLDRHALHPFRGSQALGTRPVRIGGNLGVRGRAVLKGGGGEDLRNANTNKRSPGRSLLHGRGTFSTSKVSGWRLVVGDWRRLPAVGGCWRLALGVG